MGLFIDEPAVIRRTTVDALAVLSLIVTASGFLSVLGFFIGPVLAHIALIRLKRNPKRGRSLAISALVLSYGVILTVTLTLIVAVVMAYGALPRPGSS